MDLETQITMPDVQAIKNRIEHLFDYNEKAIGRKYLARALLCLDTYAIMNANEQEVIRESPEWHKERTELAEGVSQEVETIVNEIRGYLQRRIEAREIVSNGHSDWGESDELASRISRAELRLEKQLTQEIVDNSNEV